MKKNGLYKKVLTLGIMTLLLGVCAGSVVNAQFIETIANKRNDLKTFGDDEQVEIKVYDCRENGRVEKDVIEISSDEAIELKNRLDAVRDADKSFLEMYEEQLEILKESGIIPADVTLESMMQKAEEMKSKPSYAKNVFVGTTDATLTDSLCLILLGGLGVGFPVGTHTGFPFIGADAFLICTGLFYAMTMAAGAENAKILDPGIVLGICLGYFGFLISFPVYGPLVIGIGVTLFTHWTPIL
jgi:hypothetical protein